MIAVCGNYTLIESPGKQKGRGRRQRSVSHHEQAREEMQGVVAGREGRENRRDISLSQRHIVSRRSAAANRDKSDSEAATGGNRALMVN